MPTENPPHLFCFGLGYSATELAKKLLNEGWRVSGTTRNAQKIDELRPLGITAHLFDDDMPLLHPEELKYVTHILASIPPGIDGDIILKHHETELKELENLQWIGYLSTTGVYGNYYGDWVDEESETKANNERSIRRINAENAWLKTGLPVHIFRLSGIYGAGRSAFENLQKGTAKRIYKEGQVFSRIHVDDIIQILESSIKNPNPGAIYNCADDEPAPQADVVEYAANLLGITPPPLQEYDKADLNEMQKSFYGNNRRVGNKKIKEELKVNLHYKNYKEGLDSILKQIQKN